MRTVAKHAGAETHHKVDVFVAVKRPTPASHPTAWYRWINHFLPKLFEATDGARIRQDRTVLDGRFFDSGVRAI